MDDELDDEEDGGAAGWLTTWADMMSVLLTFFIVLQAFSTISEKKFYDAMSSIQRAFSMPLPLRTPGDSIFEARDRSAEDLQEMIADEDVAGISVEDFGDRLVITVDSGVLFPLGRAGLSPGGERIMSDVAKVLLASGARGEVRVEGHTCNLPVGAGSEYEDNWWLSSARALTALEALQARGFPPERLSAAGYGEYRPVAPNDVEGNRVKNRRVDFVVEKRRSLSDR
jgi:chemotaxis protein MotB